MIKPTASQAVWTVQDGGGLGFGLGAGNTWGGPAGDLPDINVWLALAVQEHPHHAAARQYWEGVQLEMRSTPHASAQKIWFCRVTMLGLVRLLCQPKVVGAGALALDKAFALYNSFRALPCIDLLADPLGCDVQLQSWLAAQPKLPARLWTDAYLAAVAHSTGLRLVTFDKDFARFGLAKCLTLVAS